MNGNSARLIGGELWIDRGSALGFWSTTEGPRNIFCHCRGSCVIIAIYSLLRSTIMDYVLLFAIIIHIVLDFLIHMFAF